MPAALAHATSRPLRRSNSAPSSRQASTKRRKSAASRARWTSVSACHWTPIRKRPARVLDPPRSCRRAPADDDQPLAEPVDRLVVEGVDVDLADPERRRARRLPDLISTGWLGWSPGELLAVGDLGRELGQVLVQGAAADDVERLGAAADRQDRHLARVGAAGDAPARSGRGRARSGPVGVAARRRRCGVEVGAAGEADAVEAVEQRLDRLLVQRRHHHRQGARRLEPAQVGQAERHLVARRLALRGRLDALGARAPRRW